MTTLVCLNTQRLNVLTRRYQQFTDNFVLVSKLSRRAERDDCPFPEKLKLKYKAVDEKMIQANNGDEYFALTRPFKEFYKIVMIWDLEKALKDCYQVKEVPRRNAWPVYSIFCYNYSRDPDPLNRYNRLASNSQEKFDNDSSGRMRACMLYYISAGNKAFNIDVDHATDVEYTNKRLASEEEERLQKLRAFNNADTDEAKAALNLGMTVSSVNNNIGGVMAPKSLCQVPKELQVAVGVPSITRYMPRTIYEKIFIEIYGQCIDKYGVKAVDNMEWPMNTGYCATEVVIAKPEEKDYKILLQDYLVCIRKNMIRDWGLSISNDDDDEEESPVLTRSRSSAMVKMSTKAKSNSLGMAPDTELVKKLEKGKAIVVEKGSMMDTKSKSTQDLTYDMEWMDIDTKIKVIDMKLNGGKGY